MISEQWELGLQSGDLTGWKDLVFVRLNHKDGVGLGDLWMAKEVGGVFTPPVNLSMCVDIVGGRLFPTRLPS